MAQRRGTGRRGAVVAVVLGLTLLTGCGGSTRTPTTPSPVGAHPVVTARQAVQIMAAVDGTLTRAAGAKDLALAGGRVVGPAKESLTATITVSKALTQNVAVPPPPAKPRLMVPTAGSWPRWFLAAGPGSGSPTPVLRVLYSADARAPYGLWAQLNLLPGTTLPDVPGLAAGSPAVAADAQGFLRPPGTVLVHYTELLNRGDASAYRGEFTEDSYRTELNAQLKKDRAAFASKGVGTVLAKHTVPDGPVLALSTTDGGALVIGRVTQTYTATVTSGQGGVALDPTLAALAGVATMSHEVQRTSVEVLAFYLPPAGSTAPVSLLAASKADVAATGS